MNQSKNDVFVILSLGSNMGHRRENISTAFKLLMDSNVLYPSEISSLYETEPVGYKNQDWFINVAISGKTNLSLNNLIQLCKSIEYLVGRKKREAGANREIDIDIIFYGDVLHETEEITVPHPRMHERKFVLEPIAEIAGKVKHPKFNKTIIQLLDECKDESEVHKLSMH